MPGYVRNCRYTLSAPCPASLERFNRNRPEQKVTSMKMTDVYPSKWIKADDLGEDDVQLKIAGVEMEELTNENGKKDNKPACSFVGQSKKLILSKTNWSRIAQQHGDDSDMWIGKTITLYAEPEAKSDSGYAARVKVPKPKAVGGLAKPKLASAEENEVPFDVPN